MTANDRLSILYCSDNKQVAIELKDFLTEKGIQVASLSEQELDDEATFLSNIDPTRPTIILYSDNFFKSKKCMNDGLLLLQELRASLDFLPIVIDGVNTKSDGSLVTVPTEFKRVSNVIHYMNHWQDQYLELRKQKRTVPSAEEESFDKHLDIIKRISGEIGEFLRLLRDSNYAEYNELQPNNFEGLVRRLGLPNSPKTGDIETHSSSNILNETPTKTDSEIADTPNINESDQKIVSISNVLEEDIKPKDKSEVNETSLIEETHVSDADDFNEPTLQEPSIEHKIDDENINEIHKIEEETSRPLATSNFDLNAILNNEAELNPIEETIHIIPSKINEDEPEQEEIIEESTQEINIEVPNEPILSTKVKEETIGKNEGEETDIQITEKADQAKNLIASGLVKEGAAIYMDILEQQPDNLTIRYKYAEVLAKRLHNYAGATKELSTILNENDQHADSYHLLADIAQTHKDFILAKNYYEKTLTIDPKYPKVHYKIGRILSSQFPDQKGLAAKYFKQQIKLNPRHVDSHYQYAVLLNEHLGKYSKAISHFKKTLKLNPLHPFAAYDLALLYHKLYEPSKAAHYYQKAVKNNPELKTPQNEAVFLKPNMNELSRMTPLEAFEKGLHFDETKPQLNHPTETAPSSTTEYPKNDITVFITGATSGIGLATARLFAEKGYRLILTGRREDRLDEIQEELEDKYNTETNILNFDVRDQDTVFDVIQGLDKEWENIDILINNAGLAKGFAPIHEGDLEHWETMIDTNLKGLLYITRAIAPKMVKRKKGHIINLCSTAGIEVYPNGNVYCATKFGVDALTKSMRLDLYKYGIQVSQVSPAHVEETEFALVRFDGDQKRSKIYNDFNPLTSSDVADAIYYIATRPKHVQIRDIVLSGQQQATSTDVHRSGRIYDGIKDE